MSPALINIQAWGKAPPDWIIKLAEECTNTTQKIVADKIRYSTTVVNQTLKNIYKGDLNAVEQAVRGAFMDATVFCPVAGEIHANRCIEIQRQPFAATNPQRVRLFRACRSGCSHSKGGER